MECSFICRKCGSIFYTTNVEHTCTENVWNLLEAERLKVKILTDLLSSLRVQDQLSDIKTVSFSEQSHFSLPPPPTTPTAIQKKKISRKKEAKKKVDTCSDTSDDDIEHTLSTLEANRIHSMFTLSPEQAKGIVKKGESTNDSFQLLRYVSVRQYEMYISKIAKTAMEERFSLYGRKSLLPINPELPANYLASIQLYIQENLFQRPFHFNDFVEEIMTPLLGIMPLSEIFKKVFNKSSTLIFVPKQRVNSKNTGFYYLDRVDDKKYWRFDDRLGNISQMILTNVVRYITQYFRQLYFLVFNDTTYNARFLELSDDKRGEFQQLLSNLRDVCYLPRFVQLFTEIIEKQSVYSGNESDKFLGKGEEKEFTYSSEEHNTTYKSHYAELFDDFTSS